MKAQKTLSNSFNKAHAFTRKLLLSGVAAVAVTAGMGASADANAQSRGYQGTTGYYGGNIVQTVYSDPTCHTKLAQKPWACDELYIQRTGLIQDDTTMRIEQAMAQLQSQMAATQQRRVQDNRRTVNDVRRIRNSNNSGRGLDYLNAFGAAGARSNQAAARDRAAKVRFEQRVLQERQREMQQLQRLDSEYARKYRLNHR